MGIIDRHNILDFPAQVWGEAWEKAGELPGHLLTFLPALTYFVLRVTGRADVPQAVPAAGEWRCAADGRECASNSNEPRTDRLTHRF